MKTQAADIPDLERRIAEGHRRLIRLPEVLDSVGLSRSQWYLLISIGRAPRAVPLGQRARAWDESEVQAFIAERLAARGTERKAAA